MLGKIRQWLKGSDRPTLVTGKEHYYRLASREHRNHIHKGE